jgi:hypothetical protein
MLSSFKRHNSHNFLLLNEGSKEQKQKQAKIKEERKSYLTTKEFLGQKTIESAIQSFNVFQERK